MSDQSRVKRTNTLTDTGYSVQDRLKLWKQRDASSTAAVSPSKPGSLINPTPLSPHSSSKGSMSPLASTAAGVISSSSSNKGSVTSLDILSELALETEEVNVITATVSVSPSKAQIKSSTAATTATNNKTPSPTKSPAQLSPLKQNIVATTESTVGNMNTTSPTAEVTSTSNENDVFFKFINKLQTEPEKTRKPSTASNNTSNNNSNNDLNIAIPSLPISSSSSCSSSPTHHTTTLPSLSVLKARSSAAHGSAVNSTKSNHSTLSDHSHHGCSNTNSSPINGGYHSHSPPHSDHTSLSHIVSNNNINHNSSTGSMRSPRAHDGCVDKETIDRIIATVDQLHLPEQLKIQKLARHNSGKLGNGASSSNGGLLGSGQQGKEDASRRGRAASPAVERLITSIDQFKEMENLQKNIERLRAERVKKTTI